MTINKEITDRVRQSYGRCLNDKQFLEKFYRRFLASSPEVKKKFENTDFEKQKNLLSNGLNMLIMHAGGNSIAANVMNRLRDSHSAAKMDIRPGLYELWKRSLLETVRECDRKFDDQIGADWNAVLSIGIQHIAGGYSVRKAG